ncbi:phage tail sheath family protein [Serratia marcescens]|uniref:phage tail sheath family protein n=1 Tax=Serratia marcescens TaxID=615 RepID=UPI0006ED0F8F|nr:phage tail sheath C-terminal domain-containing protein [Serratia marcescens]ALL39869.1 phage tail protein [Serratia marcescens]PHI54214.1 phage tail protein [Serratia marcescens]UJA53674.1 phage tail sheath subtilisin-like domain-containing protein [Serratia marcescens]
MAYKVPGVYVEEPFGLSLSIQTGQTAVPVFAFDGEKTSWVEKDKVTEFASWLDVSERLKGKDTDAIFGDKLYLSLKLYFLNGGGHCYVAPVAALETDVPTLDDATLLVQAGTSLTTFKEKVALLCVTGKSLFALFDGGDGSERLTSSTDVEKLQEQYAATPHAAVYYPWLTAPKEASPDEPKDKPHPEIDIPPSGAVAGVYAQVDRERGVWKAPANVAIIGAMPKCKISDDVDGACNVPAKGGKAINVIRAFRGTGPLIWGARTLAADKDTWRYVPVRRLFDAAERDIRTAMSQALFEPNSAQTWERVRGAVENYVHSLWQQGALQGESPEQAYFVQIGLGSTMTQDDINSGKMIIKVGLAAVRPAEFIVLQLMQKVPA